MFEALAKRIEALTLDFVNIRSVVAAVKRTICPKGYMKF